MLPCERLCESNNAKIRFYNFNKFEEAAYLNMYVQVMFEHNNSKTQIEQHVTAQRKMNEFQKH